MIADTLKSAAIAVVAAAVIVSPVAAGDDQASDWWSRVYLDGHWDQDLGARGSVESIQPIYMSPLHTFFVQGRAAYQDEDWTFNAGLGYRYLTPDKSMLLGVNAWHDWTLDLGHRRWGLGAEAMGSVLTARSNYYGGYSGWKTVLETPTLLTEERALSGFDAELETQLPYMPWARLALGGYHWDAEASEDITGFSGRLKLDLTAYTRFETGINADNRDTSGYARISIALGAPRDVQFSLADTGFAHAEAFSKRDLSGQRLARVERRHQVVVERRTTSKVTGGISGGVVFARGS